MFNLIKKNIIKIVLTKLFVLSIVTLFTIQFKVSELNQELDRVESEIISYQEEIKILDIEWVYLTRPERLRILAKKYLKNNNYLEVSQIKSISELEPYFLANYEKAKQQKFAYKY